MKSATPDLVLVQEKHWPIGSSPCNWKYVICYKKDTIDESVGDAVGLPVKGEERHS